MQVKYRDIMSPMANAAINHLMGEASRKLDFKTARMLGVRVLKAIQLRAKDYDDARKELMEKFHATLEKGKFKFEDPSVEDAFIKEMEILADEVVELPNVIPLKAEELKAGTLSAAEWLAIEWLVPADPADTE